MNENSEPSGDQAGEARVLLADDSETERRALARLLEEAGYQVDEADSGQAALMLLKRPQADLVLLDLQMPGVDGFEVLAWLQQNNPDFPVILLSGLPPDQIQHSMQRLPTPHLPPLLLKPIDPKQLLDVVALSLRGELPG